MEHRVADRIGTTDPASRFGTGHGAAGLKTAGVLYDRWIGRRCCFGGCDLDARPVSTGSGRSFECAEWGRCRCGFRVCIRDYAVEPSSGTSLQSTGSSRSDRLASTQRSDPEPRPDPVRFVVTPKRPSPATVQPRGPFLVRSYRVQRWPKPCDDHRLSHFTRSDDTGFQRVALDDERPVPSLYLMVCHFQIGFH
jgi:hypothetical protein